MSREIAPQLVWEDGDGHQRSGPYIVRLEGQSAWQLVAHGRVAGTYRTRTAARHAAAELHLRRGLKRKLRRYLVAGAVALVVLVVALPRQSEPNPDFPPTRSFADRVDEAHLAVEAGELTIDEVGQRYGDLEGGSFEHRGLTKLGVAGVLDGNCYGMVWRPGFHPSVVFRPYYVTCAPDATIIDQPDPRGLTPVTMSPSWEYALPEPNRTPVWYIPVVAIFAGVLLGAVARATPVLVALRR